MSGKLCGFPNAYDLGEGSPEGPGEGDGGTSVEAGTFDVTATLVVYREVVEGETECGGCAVTLDLEAIGRGRPLPLRDGLPLADNGGSSIVGEDACFTAIRRRGDSVSGSARTIDMMGGALAEKAPKFPSAAPLGFVRDTGRVSRILGGGGCTERFEGGASMLELGLETEWDLTRRRKSRLRLRETRETSGTISPTSNSSSSRSIIETFAFPFVSLIRRLDEFGDGGRCKELSLVRRVLFSPIELSASAMLEYSCRPSKGGEAGFLFGLGLGRIVGE